MRFNFNWRALAHHGGAETKFNSRWPKTVDCAEA